MLRKVAGRITYANVVATLALFVVLGGTGYAAAKINGASIKKKSIPLNRLKGELPAGPQGAAGAPGAAGARGPQGVAGTNGAPGAKGDTGAQGLKGDKGDKGDQGSAGMATATRFKLGSISNQTNGQNRPIITTTGLAPGEYFVTFSLRLTAPQRYLCGVAYGSASGGNGIATYRTIASGGNPETFESSGIMTVFAGANQAPVLYCNGLAADWSASSIEIDFMKLGSVTEGVNG